MTQLPLDNIRLDGGARIRSTLDPKVIAEYAQAMQNNDVFPPVTVFFDGIDYWLADGFLRVAAAKQAGLTRIQADVKRGYLSDARLFSCGANATHGLRRTTADKRWVVAGALRHAYGRSLSDQRIAEHCGVDRKTVAKVRADLVARGELPHTENSTGEGGVPR